MKYIKTVTKDTGKQYKYRSGVTGLVPLPDLPENHPDFLAAYVAAGEAKPKAGITPAKTGTIAALCDAYIKSREFKALSKSTQQVRSRIVAKIRDERGQGMLNDLKTEHIRKDVRALTSGAASNRLKAWRGLFGFGVDEGLMELDPSREVKAPKSDGEGHRQWSKDEIAKFRAFWPNGSKERIAFEVIYWTGARCSDAATLGDTMLDDSGWLTFTQEKTNGKVTIPVHANLPKWARSLASDRDHLLMNLPSAAVWIKSQFGKPRSVKGLSQWMSERATMASLAEDCTAHGLRKARAAALAEAGATTHQIAAWTGHISLSEVSHYTRQADLRTILAGHQDD
ncbi:site-specific integrase [Marivita sp.]|uniref:site-specific integrase n=1 Tax=Marivita sp. TaxID=2003365 RepID=UPI003F7281B1